MWRHPNIDDRNFLAAKSVYCLFNLLGDFSLPSNSSAAFEEAEARIAALRRGDVLDLAIENLEEILASVAGIEVSEVLLFVIDRTTGHITSASMISKQKLG